MGMPRRHPVNKHRSARKFNKRHKLTHPFNIAIMRGGWRL